MPADASAPAADGRHSIFALLFAFYLVAHHFYLFGGGTDPGRLLLGAAFLPGAVLLMIWPASLGLFLFNAALHLAETLWLMPIFSNHAMISLFLTAGLVWAFFREGLRARGGPLAAGAYYEAYAPLGRCLLLVMYLYGTLHKVNADFLDPASSCAVWMWRRYGFSGALADSAVIHALTIYGTLAVEAAVIAMLLVRRLRYFGILAGILFHGFLGFVPPGSIQAYSLLAVMLHALFLPAGTHARFASGAPMRALGPTLARWPWRAGLVLAALLVWAALPREPAWIAVVGLILAFAAAYGREGAPGGARAGGRAAGRLLASPSRALNALAVLFLLNGLSPYLGFKTAQTVTMFSNLRTEEGLSNHLFLPSLALFAYQDRVARVIETDHPALERWRREGYRVVEFQLLDMLERAPETSARFEVAGRLYVHTPERPLAAVGDLPPRWLRGPMVFRPVDTAPPRRCDSY